MSDRLTADQQDLVLRAWLYTAPLRRRYGRSWPGLDYDSAAALRLCQAAPQYDPEKSHWRTWAINTVRFICAEVQRDARLSGFRRNPERQPQVYSVDVAIELEPLDVPLSRSHIKVLGALADPATADDAATAISLDAVQARLRGLHRLHRHLVLQTIVFGRTLTAAAAELGYSQSRGSQIRAEALERLREKEGLVPC